VVVLCGLMVGCATNQKKLVRAAPPESFRPPSPQRVLVQLESSLPGFSLNRTVWDPVSGLHPKPPPPPPDTPPPRKLSVGETLAAVALVPFILAVSLDDEPENPWEDDDDEDSEVAVLPIGPIFQAAFESRLEKVFTNALVCLDAAAVGEQLRAAAGTPVLKVKFVKFDLWTVESRYLQFRTPMLSGHHGWTYLGNLVEPGTPGAKALVAKISEEVLDFVRAELKE
jgi:hypothetical protein